MTKEAKSTKTRKTVAADPALEAVLKEEDAGAGQDQEDIESPIGQDPAIEKSVVDHNHGKKYRQLVNGLDLKAHYSKTEALELVKKTAKVNFDATVELNVKLSVSNIRNLIVLPFGTGKNRRVQKVTVDNLNDFLQQVEGGKFDFEVVVATPEVMPKLSKVAKILGPRGLMPNPKSGTVTTDIEKAAQEFAGGRIEYKQDKGGVVHLPIGKVSMSTDQLSANLEAVLTSLPQPKITSLVISSTMGPALRLNR